MENPIAVIQPQEPQRTQLALLQQGTPNWQRIPIRESAEAQNQLTELLSQLYLTQKHYADKAEALEGRDAIFQELLGGFDFCRVRWAFLEYIRTHDDLPAPANIIKLIEDQRWNTIIL